PQTGQDEDVREYVLTQTGAAEVLDTYERLLAVIGEGYLREGKRFATVAVGCTGGKHRSVAMADELAKRLAASGVDTNVVHRDLGRE
ncbi:MAG: RapZ C-terminal domain-containing protein, partial [Actinomycetes bacterium]